jgi:hypothetical protein
MMTSKSDRPQVALRHWHEPSPIQKAYLLSFRHRNFLWAGRGFGKTACLITKNFITSMQVNPGCYSMIVEATYQDINDILIPLFTKMVPEHLYKYDKQSRDIRWVNGSVTMLRSAMTSSGQAKAKQLFRGPTISSVIFDEAVKLPDERLYQQACAMIRDTSARFRYVDLVSTPEMNWIYRVSKKLNVANDSKQVNTAKLKTDGGEMTAASFFGKTHENRYLPSDFVTGLKVDYDETFAQQELYARFVAMEGRIFKTFDDEREFPAGNMVDYQHPKGKPYILSGDIGSAENCWILWSPLMLGGQWRWVAFAELQGSGGTDEVLSRIKAEYGNPSAVYIGHDVNTRDSASGMTSAYFIGQHFGSVPINKLSGSNMDKSYRLSRVFQAIKDTEGNRRLLMSKSFRTIGRDRNRGMRTMIAEYVWDDKGDGLPHNHLSHCYDSISHYIVHVNPGLALKSSRTAGY